jgi:hypothetical protein
MDNLRVSYRIVSNTIRSKQASRKDKRKLFNEIALSGESKEEGGI